MAVNVLDLIRAVREAERPLSATELVLRLEGERDAIMTAMLTAVRAGYLVPTSGQPHGVLSFTLTPTGVRALKSRP